MSSGFGVELCQVCGLKSSVRSSGLRFLVLGLGFEVGYVPELLHDAQVVPRLRIVPLHLERGGQVSELSVEGSGSASSVEGRD